MVDLIDHISKSSLPDNLILVSLNIANMFSNIDNEREMEAVRSLLDSRSSKSPSNKCMMEGLEICLLNNNSRFANIHLQQTNDTATRGPNSCFYSDTAISHLDKIINEKRVTQFQECFHFGRYRDDCLVLWSGDIEKPHDFRKMLNTLDEKLKFTMEIGGNNICLLDLRISIQNNCLERPVNSKTTDSHLYLEASSCHKKSSKNDIIKGVALRRHRICSTMADFKMKSSEYMPYLIARRHSAKLMKSEFGNQDLKHVKNRKIY